MRNTLTRQERARKMIGISSLARMRPQRKSIISSILSPIVQLRHIRIHVIEVIAVWWIQCDVPVLWFGILTERSSLGLALVVNRIESNNTLKKDVELWVSRWISGDFKQWLKDILSLVESMHT
jgi:hypothetical protein